MQLYSGRKFPLPEVLRITAAAGYAHVEGYGGLYADPPALKALLDRHGLSMPTAHVALADLEDRSAAVRLARALGVKLIVCPILPAGERPRDADGWRAIGARLEVLAQFYAGEGFAFGYHNHDFEFARFGNVYGIDLMTGEAPTLTIEADIAWMTRGRADALAWISQNGARIAATHIKDLAPSGQEDEGGWADVGYGVMPWGVLGAAIRQKTAARYFVAEHDDPSDFQRFAIQSVEKIRAFFAPTRPSPRADGMGAFSCQRPTASALSAPAASRPPICGSRRCSRGSKFAASPILSRMRLKNVAGNSLFRR